MGSFWESEDDFLYWEYLPDPRDNLTEEEYNAYRAEAEAFRLTPAGAATMADIERVVGVPVTQPDMQVEIAVLTKIGGPLTKTIKLVEGKIVSDGAACSMGNGLRRATT